MGGSSTSKVIRGGFWLYVSRIANNFGGFIYWLIISSIAGSSILGLTSVTVGLAGLINGLANLGINVGLQHFLGICIGRNDPVCFRKYFWTTTYFSFIVYFGIGGSLVAFGLAGLSFSGFTPAMLFYTGLLVMLGSSTTISSALVSMLRTDIVSIASILGNALKIIVGVFLVWIGWGFAGAVLGYLFMPFSMFAVGFTYLLRSYGLSKTFDIGVLVEVLRGSIVSWLPGVVALAGQWIGVLVVYGSSGASETGYYYVAFAISGFTLGIGFSILGLLLPVLSGLSSGREEAASRVLRISLGIITPIAVYFIFYPWLPLSLLGREYVSASTTLVVLLLGFIPLSYYAVVNSLAYSYKMYWNILYLGLSINIPRLILYMLLVPMMGGLGAAYSYTIGSYIGLLYAVFLARHIGFNMNWGLLGKILAPPILLGFLAYIFHIHWLLAVFLVSLSYLLYGRIKVIFKSDLREIAYAFLGREKTGKIYERLGGLIDIFFQ
ncbi:polysaccharide biosynthesis protein [Staphylothermus hellenicus]|uniref:Polysaccharide biosynthesis protein n=1 Tax=Staphylothermus hellenicus (strain DSM 12710 / JCM 10830 / BK20S6-10-b1 / P8) TaxID=591019 RepID=D7D888_STAHD|nr:polysaccharide biosynthesis protein [Staphylothermus hellenicus]ADI31984.1 polysaccharide biosynthesis protein [Staphylothermus hellenicus DSM 12710]